MSEIWYVPNKRDEAVAGTIVFDKKVLRQYAGPDDEVIEVVKRPTEVWVLDYNTWVDTAVGGGWLSTYELYLDREKAYSRYESLSALPFYYSDLAVHRKEIK